MGSNRLFPLFLQEPPQRRAADAKALCSRGLVPAGLLYHPLGHVLIDLVQSSVQVQGGVGVLRMGGENAHVPFLPQQLPNAFRGDDLPWGGDSQIAQDPAELGVIVGPLEALEKGHGLRLHADDAPRHIRVQIAQRLIDQRGDPLRHLPQGRKIQREAAELVHKQRPGGGGIFSGLTDAGEDHPVPPAHLHLLQGGQELPKFRQAVQEDMDGVLALYDQVIERFQAQTGTMAWRKGVYPTRANFQQAIQAGALYLGELEGALAAGMIITQGTDKTYGEPPWRVDAADEETAVIHTLGVSPALSGRGLALQMIEGAVALAREKGWRALRLDVLEDNVPAQRLYQRAGFVYIETKQIWYKSTGLASFLLYEYAV